MHFVAKCSTASAASRVWFPSLTSSHAAYWACLRSSLFQFEKAASGFDGGQVRGMAAATLKSIARWMEGQLDGAGPCQALVQQVLTQLVQEASPSASRYSGAQGPTIHENVAWDSIMPTNHSIFGASETTGQCCMPWNPLQHWSCSPLHCCLCQVTPQVMPCIPLSTVWGVKASHKASKVQNLNQALLLIPQVTVDLLFT